MLLIDPDQVNTASMATGPTPSYAALANTGCRTFPDGCSRGSTRCDRRRRRRMVNEVDNRPRCCHQARRTLKFSLDTTTHLTPGRVVGGSPPSILKLSRRGETTINKIIAGGDVEYSALVRRMLNLNQLHPRPEPSTADPADNVTVITPVFGQRLHEHPAEDGLHIIVVDDGSTPPVHDATIRLDRNCGPATARNVALTSVTTEFVAFVDADIDVGLDITWLTALLSHFDDPEVVAVAPRVRSRPQRGIIGYHERPQRCPRSRSAARRRSTRYTCELCARSGVDLCAQRLSSDWWVRRRLANRGRRRPRVAAPRCRMDDSIRPLY